MSTTFQVAHVREQGQDIVIVLVSSSFGQKSASEQNEVQRSIQACARAAQLKGTVVPVWDAGGQRMGFLAPMPWQTYFRSLSLAVVSRSINRALTCG